MKVNESKPDQEHQRLIDSVAIDSARLFDVSNENNSPDEIVTKINNSIEDLVFGRSTQIPKDEEPDLLLGALWGSQIQRQFNWYWADVLIDDEFPEVALISPQQEMIIFPFSFVAACINKQCICTIELAFNVMKENENLKKLESGGYENIMLGIHHVVPPYTLEENG